MEGLKDEDAIPEKYLSMFLDEAEATLDGLTGGLLASEDGGSGDSRKSLLAAVHKVKGSAAWVGLKRVAKFGASDGRSA